MEGKDISRPLLMYTGNSNFLRHTSNAHIECLRFRCSIMKTLNRQTEAEGDDSRDGRSPHQLRRGRHANRSGVSPTIRLLTLMIMNVKLTLRFKA